MSDCVLKTVGLAFVCFGAGILIQLFIPNLFIVILLAAALILAGTVLLKQ